MLIFKKHFSRPPILSNKSIFNIVFQHLIPRIRFTDLTNSVRVSLSNPASTPSPCMSADYHREFWMNILQRVSPYLFQYSLLSDPNILLSPLFAAVQGIPLFHPESRMVDWSKPNSASTPLLETHTLSFNLQTVFHNLDCFRKLLLFFHTSLPYTYIYIYTSISVSGWNSTYFKIICPYNSQICILHEHSNIHGKYQYKLLHKTLALIIISVSV